MKTFFFRNSVILLALVAFASFAFAQPPGERRPMMPVQIALDADKDGVISPQEINNAPAALRTLDKNNDGQLTEDEVRPNFERRDEAPANNAANMVTTLMEFDKNNDKKLSKSELPPRMQGLLARGDSNKDGFLTADELQKIAQAQAAIAPAEAPQREGMGRREGGDDHDDHGERGEQRGGPGGRGGMMRMMPLMNALDANHDGAIAADEINNAPQTLLTLDQNKDGQLTEDEMRPRGGPGRGGFGGDPQMFVQRLMEFDKNGDGKLSKDELPERMQEMMERLDTNKDGFLTPGELKAMAGQGGGRERQ